MKQEITTFWLQYDMFRQECEHPLLIISKRTIHTSQILEQNPDGALLVLVHNAYSTFVHFDQKDPCHLMEFYEDGTFAFLTQSKDGKEALYTILSQAHFLLLLPGQMEINSKLEYLSFNTLEEETE